MISPVLITGSSGQLATQFFERMRGSARVVSTSRRTLDITNADQTRRFVADLAPRLIINCAAYNHVDDAEGKRAAALRINGEAVRNLADATNAQGATLVHFSTDFVFDGEKQTPYTEEDPPQPLSVYGESKLLGERNASHADRHYVLRLSSLYGGQSRHAFIDRIIARARAGQRVPAFVERTVSPSYAPDVIGATLALVEKRAPRGVYHCGSRDWSTWDEVAAFILERLGRAELLDRVEFVPERYPAPRPRHCALSSAKLAPYYATRPWRDAVAEYLDRRVG